MNTEFDIAIVGGGINGVGIARDAAGRGLSVLLVEKKDLASGTSSAATKLIHGGLRYLEQYEFSLVRESLREREVLWSQAPHIIHPLRFILPHQKGVRPAFLVRIGLFLYDYIGGRKKLPATRTVNLMSDETGKPLKGDYRLAFEYSDCWVDDARLVVANAMDARDRGADIRVGCHCVGAKRDNGKWRIQLREDGKSEEQTVSAKILVNAAGPWVGDFLNRTLGFNSKADVRLIKGSHIVTKKLFDHDRAYIFQNADRRIVFAIPYEKDFTLIGTTDVEYDDDPGGVKISTEEIDYLCASVSEYFSSSVTPQDVVWSFSGVRPLYDDGDADAQEVTRDFVLDLNGNKDEPVLLNVFGGKLTTYRYLAERVMEKLGPWLPEANSAWSHSGVLPGGDIGSGTLDDFVERLVADYPKLAERLVRRLARSYGDRALKILDGVMVEEDLGQRFSEDMYQREVEYLRREEWARTADDILWRRSKLGLRFSPDERRSLVDWLEANNV